MTFEAPKPDASKPVEYPAPRKPWTAPALTVRSIEDLTLGTRSSTRTDGGNFFS